MGKDVARPLDLQAKRKEKGETQRELGDVLGITLYRVSELESGRFNIPTPIACEAALRYDGLTLEYKGVQLELKPKAAPEPLGPKEKLGRATDMLEEALNVLEDALNALEKDGLIEPA